MSQAAKSLFANRKFYNIESKKFRHYLTGNDVMIKKYIFAKHLTKKWRVFAQTAAIFLQKFYHNNGFSEKCNIFGRKLAEIAEICDHNIATCSKL
jgi:predicted GNAT family N-acyltransferase